MICIRDAAPDDEPEWRRLWDGYNKFYKAHVDPEITSHTWARIIAPGSMVIGRIAEVDGLIRGFSISILHEGTWTLTPICYLEDLFVDPVCRGQGIGRALIQDLMNRARKENWSRLYWHTQHNNPARKLYDEFVEADDFVRYRILFQ